MSAVLNHSTTRYTVRFSDNVIETTVTSEAASVDVWVRSIRSTLNGRPTVVGLNCEWKPNYLSWCTNKVATLQLCVEKSCLVIQLFYLDSIPQSLKSFLRDCNNTFVGVKVDDDIAKLRDDYGLVCGRSSDLGPACSSYVGARAASYFKPQLGLKDYAWEVLGFRMNKPLHVTRSNWEARTLTEQQVQYACIDAFVSYRLGRKLLLAGA